MLVAGGRRVLYVCVVVMLLVVVVPMCHHTCQVEAIRVFPGNAAEFSHGNMDDNNNKSKNKEDLFNKYFSGRTHLGPTNTTQKGFYETKRRVPSCPDPLHN